MTTTLSDETFVGVSGTPNLVDAQFDRCTFRHCHLDGSSFSHVVFRDTHVWSSSLSDVTLHDCTIDGLRMSVGSGSGAGPCRCC